MSADAAISVSCSAGRASWLASSRLFCNMRSNSLRASSCCSSSSGAMGSTLKAATLGLHPETWGACELLEGICMPGRGQQQAALTVISGQKWQYGWQGVKPHIVQHQQQRLLLQHLQAANITRFWQAASHFNCPVYPLHEECARPALTRLGVRVPLGSGQTPHQPGWLRLVSCSFCFVSVLTGLQQKPEVCHTYKEEVPAQPYLLNVSSFRRAQLPQCILNDVLPEHHRRRALQARELQQTSAARKLMLQLSTQRTSQEAFAQTRLAPQA